MNVSKIPPGFHTLTPYLLLAEPQAMIAFLEQAFDAEVKQAVRTPDGTLMHAQVQVGTSQVFLGRASGDWGANPTMLYVYVEDCDAVYARAMEAGATSIHGPQDQPYGDRVGAVNGPEGHSFWIATHLEDLSPEELAQRMAAREGE